MRVAFDARVLERPKLRDRGLGRYAAALLAALPDVAPAGSEVTALRNLRRPPAPARSGDLWEQLLLARDVRRAGADLLHAPAIEHLSMRPGVPLVVTLHDLVPLKRPGYLRTGLAHRLRYGAVRRAARVIVPSQAVAADAERLLGLDAARIAVVHEAPADAFAPVPSPRERLADLGLPERFLLWVGGLDPPDPRKRVPELVAAVAARDGLPLVLAGRTDLRSEGLAVRGRVVLAGHLNDERLAALYSAADALVFPSDDEGFGLPPVEALACGTPVAAYEVGALPESVGGQAGVELVEPGNLGSLLDAAERLAGGPVGRPTRTWADVARETWAVYDAAVPR